MLDILDMFKIDLIVWKFAAGGGGGGGCSVSLKQT